MVVVGIDPGIRNCGVAVVADGKVVRIATLASGRKAFSYAYLYRALRNIFRIENPELAVIEGAFLSSRFSSPHIESIGIIKAICEEKGVPISTYSPSAWKKILFGNGWMRKEEVLANMKRAGYAVRSSHEADALALILTYFKVSRLAGVRELVLVDSIASLNG